MATNTTVLRQRLQDLSDRLIQFDANLQTEFNMLDNAWSELDRAWDGHAYQRFEGEWRDTRAQFQAYIQVASRFEAFLKERIAAMEEMDNI